MIPSLATLIVAEFIGLIALLLHLYPWRKLEIAVLAVLGLVAAVVLLRRHKSRLTRAAWIVLAAVGALAICAVLGREYLTTGADNLPALAATRIRAEGRRSLLRPYSEDVGTLPDMQAPPNHWHAVKGEAPFVTFERHAMLPMDTLLNAYMQAGDTTALRQAAAIALDWTRHNSAWFIDPPSAFSWGDHSTALRLPRFLELWTQWRQSPLATEAEANLLERSILGHGAKLANSHFYTARHNHGVDQDIALGQLALMVDGPLAAAWRETSTRRLRRTLDDLLGPSGMTREHSPGYALAMLRHLAGYSGYVRAAGNEPLAAYLDSATARMRVALAAFVEPSGFLVTFGDTKGNVRPPEALGLPSRSPRAVQAFLEEGYAFVHEPYGADSTPLYVAVTAASNPRFAHKHCDDLSFVLSLGNRRLLVDPGSYAYTTDAWRRYFLSCEAHNTVSVPGLFQEGVYFAVGTGSASLERAEDRGGFAIITGTGTTGSGRHERALIWIREQELVIVDRVAGVTGPIGLTFHLGTGLRAETRDSGIAVIRADSGPPLMVARTLGSVPWRVARGMTNPIQGWVSNSKDQREPADVLLLSAAGKIATFVTEFALRSGATVPAAIPSAVETVESSDTSTAVTFRTRSGIWRIRLGLPTGGSVLDSISPRPR